MHLCHAPAKIAGKIALWDNERGSSDHSTLFECRTEGNSSLLQLLAMHKFNSTSHECMGLPQYHKPS